MFENKSKNKMKKNKILPLPLNNDDIYYERMMWVIYVLLCCICSCFIVILSLYLVIEKENTNSLSV